MRTTTLFAGILLAPLAVVAVLAVPAAADRAEDDLQLVKKAVGSSAVAQARPAAPPAEEPLPPRAQASPAPRKGAPTWFRVRIVDKTSKRAKVSVNLPLGLVRAFGDDWPISEHGRCRQEQRCPTLGEVLRALDSGESLVEIEDDEATVRVWVE
jgi:hypothetical protein